MRERRVILILGSQGCGKTSVAKALYGRAMSRRERVHILDRNGNLGGSWPANDDVDDWLAQRLAASGERRPTFLVLDDADDYLEHPLPKRSPFKSLFLRNRHLQMDVIVTARRAQGLPGQLLSSVDYLYVFALSSADTRGRKRILEIAPGLQFPAEKYRFVRWEPKTLDGNAVSGRTLARGGYQLDGQPAQEQAEPPSPDDQPAPASAPPAAEVPAEPT